MLNYGEMSDRRIHELGNELATLTRARIERQRRTANAPRLNIAGLCLDRSTDRLKGENHEAIEEYARAAGIQHPDSRRPYIPFAALEPAVEHTRDLTAAVAGPGGYLVQSGTGESVDILRPWSVTARAGLMIETGLAGNELIPKVTAKSTPALLSTESAQVSASNPTLALIAMTPKSVAGVVTFSRQFALQTNASAFVGREILRTIGTAIDQAVINGSGTSGQPTGLLQTAGVQTQSGTTLTAGVNTMKQKVASANVADERITYLSTPAIRELLEGRELITGSGVRVWQRDQVADRSAFVSTDVPAATMIAGDWGNIYLGIWSNGFVLEVNPFDPAGFKAGLISARIIVSVDVAVLHPTGFCVTSSIT